MLAKKDRVSPGRSWCGPVIGWRRWTVRASGEPGHRQSGFRTKALAETPIRQGKVGTREGETIPSTKGENDMRLTRTPCRRQGPSALQRTLCGASSQILRWRVGFPSECVPSAAPSSSGHNAADPTGRCRRSLVMSHSSKIEDLPHFACSLWQDARRRNT
jgi:hypothetical protein